MFCVIRTASVIFMGNTILDLFSLGRKPVWTGYSLLVDRMWSPWRQLDKQTQSGVTAWCGPYLPIT